MDRNLDGFETVWGRVMQDKEPKKPMDEAERLRFFMDKESEAAATYQVLAGKCTMRKNASTFMAIARDEQKHLKMLQSAYFILTGDSYRPKKATIRPQGMLTMLRERYDSEIKSAEGYEKAAQETRIPNLSQIFKSIVPDERNHIKVIEGMIRKIMG